MAAAATAAIQLWPTWRGCDERGAAVVNSARVTAVRDSRHARCNGAGARGGARQKVAARDRTRQIASRRAEAA